MGDQRTRLTNERAAALILLVLAAAWLSARADPATHPLDLILVVVETWFTAGAAGVLWCAASIGVGSVVLRTLWPRCRGVERLALSGSIGFGLLATLSHLLGTAGVFRAGPAGFIVSWVPILIGVVALIVVKGPTKKALRPVAADERGGTRLAALAAIPAIATLVVAACVPPGTLWESEARGYDVLSYHLALPLEWWRLGALRPLEHNVYSYLPSLLEAVYLHLAAMLGGPGAPAGEVGVSARWVAACSSLHACVTVLAGLGAAGFARALAAGVGVRAARSVLVPVFAFASMVTVPWCVVTGSLAYNEMGMVLMLVGACHAALRARRLAGFAAGLMIGAMLGCAVGFKPTAAFMGGPVAALCVLAWNRRGRWIGIAGGSLVGGVTVCLPWLVRNWASCGNPVFPALVGLFGPGHWDAGQHERWNAAHHSTAALAERVERLFTNFGAAHPQWGGAWVLFAVACAACVASRRLRRAAWPLVAGLGLQVIAWMFIGHQQSRFLVPCVATGAVLAGLAFGSCVRRAGARPVGLVMVLLLMYTGLSSARVFLSENAGAPGRGLAGGVPSITGAALGRRDDVLKDPGGTLAQTLRDAENPVAAVNILIGPERMNGADGRAPCVLLLGDATPLYFGATPILWNTTWDRWILEEARRSDPGLPERWCGLVREAGVTHVLVNYAEVSRLRGSGYSPPGMTVETVAAFLRACGEPVLEWPRRGVGLYRLKP